jgi:cell division protein FtsB
MVTITRVRHPNRQRLRLRFVPRSYRDLQQQNAELQARNAELEEHVAEMEAGEALVIDTLYLRARRDEGAAWMRRMTMASFS